MKKSKFSESRIVQISVEPQAHPQSVSGTGVMPEEKTEKAVVCLNCAELGGGRGTVRGRGSGGGHSWCVPGEDGGGRAESLTYGTILVVDERNDLPCHPGQCVDWGFFDMTAWLRARSAESFWRRLASTD